MAAIRCIQDIPTWMDEGLDASGASEVESAIGLVQELVAEDNLEAVLESLVGDEHLLQAVADRSYAHDNGFDKIQVATSRSGWKLRLNIWWPDRDFHTENVHNHRWDFASALVAGGFRADYFDFDPNGPEQYAYVYSRSGRRSYTHEYLGVRRVSMVLCNTMRQGDSYFMTRALMHRITTSPGQLAATVMLRSPERAEEAITLVPTQLFEQPTTAKAPLRATELAKRLSDLLSR